MGLYKEADHFLTECYKKQGRIYKDSCDIGIIVDGPDDPLCKKLADMFHGRDIWGDLLYGIKRHRSEQRRKDGTLYWSMVSIYLPWEMEGEMMRCTEWQVTYTNDRVRNKEFVSFEPRNVNADEKLVYEEE